MAAPKKGSRTITVDGTKYRWRVRHKPTYSQALGWGRLSFSVETESGSGCLLLVACSGPRPDAWTPADGAVSLTPSKVAAFIRRALAGGWAPEKRGKPFRLAAD